MKKPVVFVTQVPNKKDATTGAFVPVVNISPATEHGDIRIMMPATANFFATNDLTLQLNEGLKDYDFDRGDSIVALGDPVIIAVVGALLARISPSFYVLRWDKNLARYVKIKVQIGDLQ